MVSTRSNKVYYNDAGGIENHRTSANLAKVVAAVKKTSFVPPPEKKLWNMILQQLWKDIENELKMDETEGRSYGIITSI
jgi:hypothetical protein